MINKDKEYYLIEKENFDNFWDELDPCIREVCKWKNIIIKDNIFKITNIYFDEERWDQMDLIFK